MVERVIVPVEMEAGKVGGFKLFVMNLGNEYKIIDPVVPRSEKTTGSLSSLSWDQELLALESYVASTEEAQVAGNELARDGMIQLQSFMHEGLVRRSSAGVNKDEFKRRVLATLALSYSRLSMFEERPTRVYKNKTGIYYKNPAFDGLLNPRDIRLIVKKFSLNGVEESIEEARAFEEVPGIYYHENEAFRRLLLAITPNYRYIPISR